MKFFLFVFILLSSWASWSRVDSKSLSEEVQKRFQRVPEFEFIIAEAEKLGVDVYLFGGTASAFAHYVRWDLEREEGDAKYQKERFDYDFTNIYRGNQDLDLVVDGTAEQAAALEKTLKQQYPHFVGNKEAWEIRLLRAQVKDKLPLIDNFDFLNQHTDTNSTGMLALTAEPHEIVFRDLFAWENADSDFLKDVTSGQIKFLFSKTHHKTSRFKEGKNPPIFAAIRYLAKLAQYEVQGTPQDLNLIKKIIQETDWKGVQQNAYVRHKLSEFGKKVLLNAPDSEFAWNLLEETGLRKQLIAMDENQIQSVDSLSWWLNKEPLRSSPLGQGKGALAQDLFKNHMNEQGEIVLAHETNSFQAYDNITRSSLGKANAFISRENAVGETAVYGDGFYTRLGRKGARGTNLTIRFRLHPEAREGSDFIHSGDYVVVKNKSALTLIQENLNISMVDFLILLENGDLSISDKGLLEKFKRKFGRVNIESDEFKEAYEFVKEGFFIAKDFPQEHLFDFSHYKMNNFDDLLNLFTEQKRFYFRNNIGPLLRNEKFWSENWIEALVEKGFTDDFIIRYILSREEWSHRSDLLDTIQSRDKTLLDKLLKYILSKPYWSHRSDIVKDFLSYGNQFVDGSFLRHFFSVVDLKDSDNLNLLEEVLERNLNSEESYPAHDAVRTFIRFVLSREDLESSKKQEWIHRLMKHSKYHRSLFLYIFARTDWVIYKDYIDEVFNSLSSELGKEMLAYLGSQVTWKEGESPLKQIMLFNPEIITGLINLEFIEAEEYWVRNFDTIKQAFFIRASSGVRNGSIVAFAKLLKSEIFFREHKDFIFLLYNELVKDPNNLAYVQIFSSLKEEHWLEHPEVIEEFFINGLSEESTYFEHFDDSLLFKSGWTNHPVLLEYLGGEEVSYKNLAKRLEEKSLKVWLKEKKEGTLSRLTCSSVL